MRKSAIIILSCFLAITSWTQNVDFDQVVVPENKTAANFRDYLVQLTWLNTPTSESLDYQVNIAEQDIKNKRLGWVSAFGINLGLTQNQGIDSLGVGPVTNFFTPRVSVGATINILPLLVTPGRVKIAKEKLKIAENDIDFEKLKTRAEVYRRYEAYELALEVLKVRTQMNEDATANYKLLTEMFKSGEAQFEDYNNAYTSYHKAQEEKLRAESDIKLAVISIEELIGIRFEEAKRLFANQQ